MSLIYLAGPVFSVFERERNATIQARLEAQGFSVFLPQNIGGEKTDRPAAGQIFSECVSGLEKADGVLGLVDGPDIDSGTAWEIGYAFARGKLIVLLRTDYRGAEDGVVNIMIQKSANAIVEHRELRDTTEMALTRTVEVLVEALRDGSD